MLKVGRAVLIAFALMALVLAACERDEDDGDAASSGPSADSVLRVGNGNEVQFLDAAKSQSGSDIIFSEMVYNRLLQYDATMMDPKPDIAESLGSVG